MSLSLDTLQLLQTVLHAQQLDGRAEDFEDIAAKVLVARRELAEEISQRGADGEPEP